MEPNFDELTRVRASHSLGDTARGIGRGIRHRSPVIGAMALKFAGAAMSFLVTLVIARAFGAAVSGQFALLTQTVVTFGMFAMFGNDHLLVRRIAGFLAAGRADLARLSFSHARRIVGLSALGLAVLVAALSPWADLIGADWRILAIAAVGILLQPLLMLASAALRAMEKLVQSQALLLVQPTIVLVSTVWLGVWGAMRSADLALAGIFVGGLAVAAAIALVAVQRIVGNWPSTTMGHPDEGRTNSVRLGLIIACDAATVWAALSLTGGLLGVAEAGVFRVCMQFITVVAMIGTTLDGMLGPRLAAQFHRGDLAAARKTLSRSYLFLLMAGGPPLVLIAILAEPLLAIMGEEFRSGAATLRILAAGQLVVMAAGVSGAVLNMGHREDISLKLAVLSLAMVVPTLVVLIEWLGTAGAAGGMALMWLIRYQGSNAFARRIINGKVQSTFSGKNDSPI